MVVQATGAGQDMDGVLGKIVSYSELDQSFTVCMANGDEAMLKPESLKLPESLKRPGLGGGPESFDLLVGPGVEQETMAEEVAACLFEKGFCVLRKMESKDTLEKTFEAMKEMAEQGKLARLPEEVEPGYLGENNRGKVVWMDGDVDSPNDDFLKSCDEYISKLAALIQPYSADIFGKHMDERTSALMSMSLTDDEEPEYPPADSDDKTLGTFMSVHKRSLLKVAYFLGPASPSVMLEAKDDVEGPKTACKQDAVEVTGLPSTILIFRPDVFSYSCSSDEEALSLTASFLCLSSSYEVVDWEGDRDAILLCDGPPQMNPAYNDRALNVVNQSTRIMAGWDEPEMYRAGLVGGCDTGVEIPLKRWNVYDYWDGDTDSLQPWMSPTRHQSMVEGVELFDNKYFEIAANECRVMDPMQRLTLEAGAQNLFKMGITKKVSNRNPHHGGCSVGLDKDDWDLVLDKEPGGNNVQAIISNRFSFIFNLRGPNYVADTACSASMCATHLAKFTLLDQTIDKIEFHIGIGLHLCLVQRYFSGGRNNTMNSPIGRCLTFNATASGYMRGDGCSGITLKCGHLPEERDAIWRASFCGQNGRSATLTAPNGLAQGEIIQKAYMEGEIKPVESCVWSCHGTGTSLGDPIEVGAIRRIHIKESRPFTLTILTNKTNCGHLEGGAAMTSLIAAVWQIKKAYAIPCVHQHTLNPNLEQSAFDAFYNSELNVVRDPTISKRFTQNIVHISSFGFGGTNGHVIMWGQSPCDTPNVPSAIRHRIRSMQAPEVRVNGNDPTAWEWDGPDIFAKPGEKYKIDFDLKAPYEGAQNWQKVDDAPDPDDEEDDFYCIVGPFNEWDADRMGDGPIVGMRTITLEVPESGELEFRFLKNGEEDQVIYPEVDKCTRKTGKVLGPASADEGKEKYTWLAEAPPGAEMKIDLFACRGKKAVMWQSTGGGTSGE
jgi:polyketide synthase-associated protein